MRAFAALSCVLVVAVSVLFRGECGEAEELSLPALAKQVRPAVFVVLVNDNAGREIGSGTGFLVSEDGKLVTNNHVIENGVSFSVKGSNGGIFKVERIVSRDAVSDLAILKVDCKEMACLKLGSSAAVEAGTRVAVVGSPLGLEGTLSEGIVSAIRNDGQKRWIQMTAAISPGSSGSPVLNAAGDVIGVAAASVVNGQALNMAVPVESVKKLLAAPEVPVADAAGTPATPGTTGGECPVCGKNRGRLTATKSAYGAEQDFHNKWKKSWCHHCADGRALITECYHLLGRLAEANKKLPEAGGGRQAVRHNRREELEARKKQLESELADYKDSKVDVRDAKAKAEKNMKETAAELGKLEGDNRSSSFQDRTSWFLSGGSSGELLDFMQKEMVMMNMPIPEKIEPGAMPSFKVNSMDDLVVAARANLDAKGKAATTIKRDAATRASRVYLLKDGRKIKTKLTVQDGENIILKTEDGKMITVKKSDVEAVGDE